MILRSCAILIIFSVVLQNVASEEIVCTINTKKSINRVSDKFLSISIDPAVLLTGLNLSDKSLQLARHLSPAYIRVAGPSTQLVRYRVNNDKSEDRGSKGVDVTPSMWFGINEWLALANLTPVFGINDASTTNGVWSPKGTLPLLELSDRLNVSALWQLGFDCTNKTELEYKRDLSVLKEILDSFPTKKNTWKIVASDISRIMPSNNLDLVRKLADSLKGMATAIMWEPVTSDEFSFPERDIMTKLLTSSLKPSTPVWTTAPKPSRSVSFTTAIVWLNQLSEAAKLGYEVVFRQPRWHEMFSETPAYWASLLYKTLMGRNVMEVKVNTITSDTQVYAHCAKSQDSFSKRGAMTILVINNATNENTVQIRLGSAYMNNVEVQSYVLTAPYEASTQVFLNDEKLTTSVFKGNRTVFTPKLRRAKVSKHLSLIVPSKSIGFFVLPGARVPLCINEESELTEILEEIEHDQTIPLFEDESVEVEQRWSTTQSSLREMQRAIEKELESDERYYNEHTTKQNTIREDKMQIDTGFKKPTKRLNEIRDYFVGRNKNRHANLEKRTDKVKDIDLELTSAEIKRVLADRAKAKAAAKHIRFTSTELDALMEKATERLLAHQRNTTPDSRRKIKRQADPFHNVPQDNIKQRQKQRENRMQTINDTLERIRNRSPLKPRTEKPDNRNTRIETLRNSLRDRLSARHSTTERPQFLSSLRTRLETRNNAAPRVSIISRSRDRTNTADNEKNGLSIAERIRSQISLRSRNGDPKSGRTRSSPPSILNRHAEISQGTKHGHPQTHDKEHVGSRQHNGHITIDNHSNTNAQQVSHGFANLEAPNDNAHSNAHNTAQEATHISLVNHNHDNKEDTQTHQQINNSHGTATVTHERKKRDINMNLLKIKTRGTHDDFKREFKSMFKNGDRREATLRRPGETSEELLQSIEENVEEDLFTKRFSPQGNIYAELATSKDTSSDERLETTTKRGLGHAIHRHNTHFSELFPKNKPIMSIPEFKIPQRLPTQPVFPLPEEKKSQSTKTVTRRKTEKEVEVEEPLQFLTEKDGFESSISDDGLNRDPCIQEYFDIKAKYNKQWEPKPIDLSITPRRKSYDNIFGLKTRTFSFSDKENDDLDLSKSSLGDYSDIDSDEKPVRFRRSVNRIRKEDIRQKRKEIKEKLELKKKIKQENRAKKFEVKPVLINRAPHPRLHSRFSKLQNQAHETKVEENGVNEDKRWNEEPVHVVVGHPEKAARKKINDHKKLKQIEYLKSRLSQKKKIEDKKANRLLKSKKNAKIDKNGETEINNTNEGAATEETSVLANEDSSINNLVERRRRSVDIDVDTRLNEVDSVMNEIIKETNILRFIRDSENYKYQKTEQTKPDKNVIPQTFKPLYSTASVSKQIEDYSSTTEALETESVNIAKNKTESYTEGQRREPTVTKMTTINNTVPTKSYENGESPNPTTPRTLKETETPKDITVRTNIDSKEGHNFFDNMVTKMKSFFKNVGTKLGNLVGIA